LDFIIEKVMSSKSNHKKVHDFQESLKIGQKIEAEWLELMGQKFPEYDISKADGRSHDFVVTSPFGPFKLELKADSYSMYKTENVFIERWSVFEKEKPGGPYQSQINGVDLYCYYFSQQKIMLTSNVNKLIVTLDELELKDKDLIPIFNKGYTTKGWKVPRKALNDKNIITYCYLDDSHDGLL